MGWVRPWRTDSRPAVRPRAAAGWTLIELVVVIALMSTLVAIAMIGYGTAVTRTREAVLKEDLFRMRDAIDQYHADRNEYPPALESLVAQGYLRAIPEDPLTQSTTTWQVVLAEYDPANPLSQGVFDVRSGASGTGLDGSTYAEW
jgi:general secretion pathway protein G